MPNHVTNILKINGGTPEENKTMMDLLFDSNGDFTFDNFLPMPKELIEVKSPVSIVTEKERNAEITEYERKEVAGQLSSFLSRAFSLTDELRDEYIARFGADNWYDWAIENWGTKWGGYDGVKNSDSECGFLTAWNTPYSAMVKLSEMYPKFIFMISYADEDTGNNVGEYHLTCGDTFFENTPENGSIEAYKLAITITGDDYQLSADYINDLIDDKNNELDDYARMLLNVVYDSGLVGEYCEVALDYLKGRAMGDDENYEYLQKLMPSNI
tara:strand:- start:605 stop:1414 length:810 start_codon:yes stop_codon:yes gene_type:complete